MTIPEEIEQLKIKLEHTAGEREEAEILLEMLKKCALLNNSDTRPYLDRLLQIAENLDEPLYTAWYTNYLGQLNRLNAEYEVSLELYKQAIAGFELIGNKAGVATVYGNVSRVYQNQGNFSEALKIQFAALKIREEIGDKNGVADSMNDIAGIYFFQGNYPQALKKQFDSLSFFEELDDKNGIASANQRIGNIYTRQGNFPEALKAYFTALRIFTEIGAKHGIAITRNGLGIAFSHQGNYPDALKNYSAALMFYQETGNKHGIANSYNNIASVNWRHGNYPEALKNYFEALNIFNEIGAKHGMGHIYEGIGSVYLTQANYPEALKNYFEASKHHKEAGDKHGIANTYLNIGGVYHNQGNYAEALKNQTLALQLAKEVAIPQLIKKTSLALADVFSATEDYENALKYYKEYHAVEKEMLGEQSQKQLNDLNFMHNMEQKEKDLEIEQLRNVELKKEKDRSESLLLNILPAEVAEELKEKGTAAAKHFDNVTVLFTDFKGFTTVSEKLTPQQLVDELHACFSAFDKICEKYNIEKIKTVGDAYLAVSGLPLANANHAEDMVKAAIEIRNFIANRKKESDAKAPFGGLGAAFEVRIGIHSGSVVAGIVGVKKFAYDIWGDTVNTAARMEQNGEAGKVNISEATYELVKDKFECAYRGEIEAKNKGKLKMYFIV